MGHRLTRIYTRTGDKGSTALGDGSRTGKDSPRIEVIGAVDELNCLIGRLLTHPLPQMIAALLTEIQHDLFDLGGELSMPGTSLLDERRTGWLEQQLDSLNAPLPPLKEFILPGGTPQAAEAHLARAVCRRAERSAVRLGVTEALDPAAIVYLNRLSDLLFVMARWLNRQAGVEDVLWRRDRGM